MIRPVSSASCWRANFQSRSREPLEPPAVGRDHQAPHPGIELPTHLIEPASDGVDGELPGVVVDSEADIAEVGADVGDPVRDDLAQLLVLEIVSVDLDRFALRFLLLRVDRYHGFAGRLKRLDLRVDIFELGVAIRMFAGFLGLAVGMATIFQFLQQLGNGRGTHFVTARSAVASLSWLLGTHRNGRIGSPIVAGSSNRCKSSNSVGSLTVNRGVPPPLRRTSPVKEPGFRKSFRPRPIVLRATFVARATAAIPP